jgi:hypothetical protein
VSLLGEYPLRLLFRAEFTGFKITNLEIAAGDDHKLSLVFSASRTNSYFSGRMFMSS